VASHVLLPFCALCYSPFLAALQEVAQEQTNEQHPNQSVLAAPRGDAR
jgi:hypothetical protein